MTKKIEVPQEQLEHLLTLVGASAPEATQPLVDLLNAKARKEASDAEFAKRYPNLAKESEVKDQAQEVFQFLEFLAERGVNLAKYQDGGDQLVWASHRHGKTGFIDDFYELDRKATEVERTALLESTQGTAPEVQS